MLAALTGVVSAAVYEFQPEWIKPLLAKGMLWSKKADARSDLEFAKVKRGPFLISLIVQGQLDSQKNSTLTNQVEGTTTIINIVPEGTKVNKGEIVCELDSSALQDKSRQQEIAVTTADSAYIKATEDLKIQLNQNESDIAAADLALTLAILDLEKFKDGEFPQQQSELAGTLKIAEENYVQSKESYEFTQRQVEKGTTQQNVLEAARIKMQQAEYDRESAKKKLEVLEDFTRKRTIAELEAQAKELANEKDRVKIKADAARTQFEKDQEAKALTLKVERDKLERYLKQIEACTLRAPQDGEVVYANLSNQGRGRGGQQGPAIEVGGTVYERQAIINLPDVSQMKVTCRIHESLIGAVRQGLAARVRVDAYSNEPYNGTVASVASVPMTGNWPNFDLREYPTEITLNDSAERIRKLRPGLTASVEILVDNRENVLQIPMQGVVTVADKHVAFVMSPDGKVVRRDVEIGPTNQSHIEILKGLQEGDAVVLNSRSHFAPELAAFEADLVANKPKELAAMTNAAQPAPAPAPAGEAPAAGGPPAGPGGAAGSGPPGAGRGGEGRQRDPKAFFARLDKNSDGSLTEDEVPEQMKANFATLDKDSDGKITADEFAAGAAAFGRGRPGGPGGEGGAGGPGGASGGPGSDAGRPAGNAGGT